MIPARRFLAVVILIAIAVGATAMYSRRDAARAHGLMSQQAYVWNRAWTPAVRDSVRTSSSSFAAYVVLAAEVSFHSVPLDVARVPVDYASLKNTGIPVGIAVRIGRYSGHFAADDAVGTRLTDVAASLIDNARIAGLSPPELQIDFDCAQSKLDGYRVWVEAIRRRVAPVAVTITALPSWLSEPSFAPLARAAGGYVLQIHSLQRPTSADAPMILCDPSAARRWVEQAGRIGVPFRVALPTYGYFVAFDGNGIFKGLSAEGIRLDWPAGTRIRALRADPAAMADLVRQWNGDRPRCMAGVIWYRLPTVDDALNWRWTTLQSVMSCCAPRAMVRAAVVRSEPRLFEVQLLNDGRADAPMTSSVTVRWRRASLVAADALGGFEQVDQASDEIPDSRRITFRASPAIAPERLAPGDHRAVAWLRLSEDMEVQANVSTIDP